jgi:putative phosphoesterase
MRIAALYDIHGNLPALEAVLKELSRESVDQIVIGGDVLPGPMPRETLDMLLALKTPTRFILGNGEVAILQRLAGEPVANVRPDVLPIIEWTADQLRPEHVVAISRWPKTTTIEHESLGGILFCHGTPRDENEIFTRLTADDRLTQVFSGIDASLVVCGHTHMQFKGNLGDLQIVNAGSVGLPFGQPGAYWLVIDSECELRCTNYDLEQAAVRIRATDYPQADQLASTYILNPPSEAQMLEVFSRAERGNPN